jgi:hypothetical protein
LRRISSTAVLTPRPPPVPLSPCPPVHTHIHTQLVEAGQLPEALLLARAQLTPLADKHPELLPKLKASMAALLPGSGGSSGGSSRAGSAGSPSNAGSSAAAAKVWDGLLPLLQARLGVEQPRLVQLLGVLLTTHRAWFRMQRCSDPFAGALAITQLQQGPAAASASASAAAAAAGEAAHAELAAGSAGARTRPSLEHAAAAPGGEAAAEAAGAGSGAAPAGTPAAAAQMARLMAGAAAGAGGGMHGEDYQAYMDALWGGGGGSGGGGEGGASDAMDEDEDGGEEFDEGAVLQVRGELCASSSGCSDVCLLWP